MNDELVRRVIFEWKDDVMNACPEAINPRDGFDRIPEDE